MANTVWKGQLTFGLVSFPVRLVRAARKERILLRYVREVGPLDSQGEETTALSTPSRTREWTESEEESPVIDERPAATLVAPVRQAYVADEDEKSMAARELQRGYEVAPGQFAVLRSEELR